MIKASLSIPYSEELAALFEAEESSFRHRRAAYKTGVKGNELQVTIEADDATALKATVSSVCRVVAVFEKARRI